MSEINIEEKKDFFSRFYCEVLTSKDTNKEELVQFSSKKASNDLEGYLLDEKRAWADDYDGETRVYLIKDMAGNIACYFSIKCGLLVGDDVDESLSDDERQLLELYVDAKRKGDEDTEKQMYDAINSYCGERADTVFAVALKRLERKTEAIEIGQSESTVNFPQCYSAIELKHFCRNEKYSVPSEINTPLGFGLFWEVIVPRIIEIASKVGCKYLYLFAANDSKTCDDPNVKKLVRYYKNELKFHECGTGVKLVKPDYDNYCYGLIQEIALLGKNRSAVWEEFSDV